MNDKEIADKAYDKALEFYAERGFWPDAVAIEIYGNPDNSPGVVWHIQAAETSKHLYDVADSMAPKVLMGRLVASFSHFNDVAEA